MSVLCNCEDCFEVVQPLEELDYECNYSQKDFEFECDCGRVWCSDECAVKDGLIGKPVYDDDGEVIFDVFDFSCNHCRIEIK